MAPFGGFDHNMQALRVLTLLENRYAEHDGLNLTWETLEGILKHNGPLIHPDGTPVPRYAAEGLPFGAHDIPAAADLRLDSYASLEAQAAAIADDVAYNAHDIDDGLRAGLLVLEDMISAGLAGPIVREVLDAYPSLARNRQAHEVQRRLITRTIEDVIDASRRNISEAGVETPEDVRMAGRPLVTFSAEAAAGERELKRFMFDRVYRHESVMVPVRRSEAVVRELFGAYMNSRDMPGRWGSAARVAEDQQVVARVVCDFIAGMTDPYALDEYQRLFDARPEFR
jgi:dGTPase